MERSRYPSFFFPYAQQYCRFVRFYTIPVPLRSYPTVAMVASRDIIEPGDRFFPVHNGIPTPTEDSHLGLRRML